MSFFVSKSYKRLAEHYGINIQWLSELFWVQERPYRKCIKNRQQWRRFYRAKWGSVLGPNTQRAFTLSWTTKWKVKSSTCVIHKQKRIICIEPFNVISVGQESRIRMRRQKRSSVVYWYFDVPFFWIIVIF